MTPEELELARSLLATVQNTTVQGWDILVNGTIIESMLDLVGVALFILIGLAGSKYITKHIPPEFDQELGRLWQGPAIAFFLIVLCVCINVFLSSIMGVCIPQYTILEKILGGYQ